MPQRIRACLSPLSRGFALAGCVLLAGCLAAAPPASTSPEPPTDMIVIEIADAGTALTPEPGAKGRPLMVGRGIAVPAEQATLPLATLPWRPDAGGSRLARIQIRSPGATALRAALTLDQPVAGLTLRFEDAADRPVTTVSAAEVLERTQRYGRFWSPFVHGESVTVVLVLDDRLAPQGVMGIPLISRQP